MYWSKPYNETADDTSTIITTEVSMDLGEWYERSSMRDGCLGKRMVKIPNLSDAF
jgi:hypothetical protein